MQWLVWLKHLNLVPTETQSFERYVEVCLRKSRRQVFLSIPKQMSTGRKDFRRFHRAQAVAFREKLNEEKNARTGAPLSKATILATLSDLRAFFMWLAREPGFKSHIHYRDADYFNLSAKDIAVARSAYEKRVPSLDQARRALSAMPAGTLIERRDRALFAFAMITGARISAIASFRVKHVDLAAGLVNQDARLVRTKRAKSFVTHFMPVDDDAPAIVASWIAELTEKHGWSPDDPLFPATDTGVGLCGGFAAIGLTRRCWADTQPIREVFRRAFAAAGLPYYNPHSFRDMLVHHAMSLGLGPEAMKAWSQNLGHADVLTTFTSYGQIPVHRQGELIQGATAARETLFDDPDIRALITKIQRRVSADPATSDCRTSGSGAVPVRRHSA
jgi:integrase